MKVSVIIPTYNSEKTIGRAIKSVLAQEGLNNLFTVEILICDDCSTDDTLFIATVYPARVFASKKNSGGPNRGRNVGIKNATGDLIAFLDHDDEWLPTKIKDQINEINKGYELVYSRCIKQME